jgi:hypothetical protein
MGEGTSMPQVQITVDTEAVDLLRVKARDALLAAERRLKRAAEAVADLHDALKAIDDLYVGAQTPGTIQPMSGGDKPPPPGGGG